LSLLCHTLLADLKTLSFIFIKKPLLLIDTAGIRRKGKIKSIIEKLGVEKSFETIKKANVVLNGH